VTTSLVITALLGIGLLCAHFGYIAGGLPGHACHDPGLASAVGLAAIGLHTRLGRRGCIIDRRNALRKQDLFVSICGIFYSEWTSYMNVINNVVAGTAALLGVLLGGFITVRNQERMWIREHDRQWRDIRLRAFDDFVAAYRGMMAYIRSPDVEITSTPHPRRPGEWIPYFSESGRPIREQLEVTISKIRLIALSDDTPKHAHQVVYALRDLAAARAQHPHDEMPDDLFVRLFAAQQRFLTAARAEVGLPELPDRGREPEGGQNSSNIMSSNDQH
jgi:hypothetical protein